MARYSNLTALAILQWLIHHRGHLTHNDLEQNDKHFIKPWNGITPFKTVIECMQECADMAKAGGDAYSDRQMLNNALTLVQKTNTFIPELREWHNKPQIQKNMGKLQNVHCCATGRARSTP